MQLSHPHQARALVIVIIIALEALLLVPQLVIIPVPAAPVAARAAAARAVGGAGAGAGAATPPGVGVRVGLAELRLLLVAPGVLRSSALVPAGTRTPFCPPCYPSTAAEVPDFSSSMDAHWHRIARSFLFQTDKSGTPNLP